MTVGKKDEQTTDQIESDDIEAGDTEIVESEIQADQDVEGDEISEEQLTTEEEDSEEDIVQRELENLREQLAGHQDAVLRTQAEMENLRKRTSRDIENAHKYALDKFIKELLPVIDSLELGISAGNDADDLESLIEGMDLTLKKFVDTLGKFGVAVVDPVGEKFDPEKHEAVSMQEIEDVEAGNVVTVMQKGYELNGRLVRPAMVVVAK